jgi:hypothetical protein
MKKEKKEHVMVVFEKPENCRSCPCYDYIEEWCGITHIETKGRYLPIQGICPLKKTRRKVKR